MLNTAVPLQAQVPGNFGLGRLHGVVSTWVTGVEAALDHVLVKAGQLVDQALVILGRATNEPLPFR